MPALPGGGARRSRCSSQQYSSKGVAFLGDDVGDTPSNALAFTRSVGISYPSVSDPGYLIVQKFSQVAPVSDTPPRW